ncbi:unnamed protein product [Acanthoscelides obtectus]|uniref:Uncharacterized protein n=1 Tax=Acanthoscelides obtectus TaxID=200917 RepID=A0A9P0KQ57_ACAOB|nr:unnamed protein product [Acanthoscelides obtectus]CAK1658352.1 hypothetical protein AOBTE_LOCUS20840 [Acanthoscelides obtectus]
MLCGGTLPPVGIRCIIKNYGSLKECSITIPLVLIYNS